MRSILAFILISLAIGPLVAQTPEIDSLKNVLQSTREDSSRVQTLIILSTKYYRSAPQEALRLATEARDLAQKLGYNAGLAQAFKSMGMAHYFSSNWVDALLEWERSLSVFEEIGDQNGIANMLNNLGAVHFNQGGDEKAIEYYLRSLRAAEGIGDTLRIATALVNIGAVYFNKQETHNLALEYYLKALPLSELLGDQDAIGTTSVNLGEIYLERNLDDSALFFFDKALTAYRQTSTGNVPYALNSMGKVNAKRGDYRQAIQFQTDAFELAKSQDNRLEMAQSLLGLANTYEMQGDHRSAISSFNQAKLISTEIGASYQLKDAFEGLANSYARISDFRSAYEYHTRFSGIKDTLYNVEMSKRVEALMLNSEIQKKQGQIDLLEKDQALKESDLRRQKAIRNATALTGVLLLIMVGGLFNRYKYVRKTNKIIADEKERSDKLLLNILPVETAEELKEKGSATPKHYDMVSVLFTDFKGFTNIAEKLTPQELVEELNQCFMAFDRIIDRHKLEKIKTIGDAYMCAGGIPVANTTNPVDIVKAALEIREFMENLKRDREAAGKDYWELRIGIHTGPVIAGVVGKNKFAYDIWGDAVNTASRMESSGIPGQVNISGFTFEYIRDHFQCSYRGKVSAKIKGEIDMYIV